MSGACLYAGSMWNGSTTAARMRAMQDLGVRVLPFDITPLMRSSSWVARQLTTRFCRGSLLDIVNRDLLDVVVNCGEHLETVWIDKGLWILPETLEEIRRRTGAKLVHYTPDPQMLGSASRLQNFWRAVPHYDVHFTTKPYEVAAYRSRGARQVHLVDQSYCEQVLAPRAVAPAERQRFTSEVCFVGSHELEREPIANAILAAGHVLKIWGPRWRRHLWRRPAWRQAFVSDGLYGAEYGAALHCTRIALCLLSKQIPDTTTTRSFEIPGSGAFMLAERTTEHQALYVEGKEAEFFSGADEMLDKIRFYLAHEAARQRIANAGHVRSVRSGYGNRARMRSLLNLIAAVPEQAMAS